MEEASRVCEVSEDGGCEDGGEEDAGDGGGGEAWGVHKVSWRRGFSDDEYRVD